MSVTPREDRSVRPSTAYLRSSARRPATHAAARRPPVARRRAPSRPQSVLTDRDDRIPVTGEIGPTVARQLAAASRRPVATTGRQEPARRARKSDPKADYKRYYQALRAGNHAFAITGFKHFIERHPRHSYADNALYWLAEAHYDQRAYRVALDAFRKVERDYPTGNKVPDALLKIAFCHIALGERASARAAMAELTERYPRSKPAALAAERLAATTTNPAATDPANN